MMARPAAGLVLFVLLLGCSSTGSTDGAGTSTGTGAGSATLRLGIVGDQTLAEDLDAAYAVLARGVEELSRYHREVAPLDAVVHVGDLVESREAPGEVERRFAEAAGVLDRLPVRWLPVAGDHDVNPPGYAPGSADRSRRELFGRLVAERVAGAEVGPDGLLRYAVDLAGFRLFVLDSQEVAHADPRWGDVFLARIGAGQLAWLAAELGRSEEPAVVVLHQPLWLAWSGWQPVHELLRRHRVAAVVSGHLHHPQDAGTLDGIRYLTVGATGGVTRGGRRSAGSVHHVTVLELAPGGDTRVTLLPLDGRPLALPARRDMERAQALDMMLGGLWDLSSRTPLHVTSDGRLVADCTAKEPARLVLARLGNPIDREVRLTIEVAEPVVALDASFAAGFCREEDDREKISKRENLDRSPPAAEATCLLSAPSPNVLYSNPSGVELSPDPPLWQASLTLAPSAPPPAAVDLSVTLSWPAEAPAAQPLHLRRSATLPVSPCP